ncbi:MAG: ribosome maturation factor RimM [Christensenellales bacterium]|jgi:16S rRNA processing protein RimM
MKNEYLLLGTVTRPRGIRGEMKINPCTNRIDRFLELREVWIKEGDEMVSRAVSSANVSGNSVFLCLEGVESLEQAEAWRGTDLYVRRDQAIALGRDEWFIVDLIGCRVQDEAEETLGVLEDVLQSGAQDVYALRSADGTVLIPAVRVLIRDVDPARGVITVSRERFNEMAVFSREGPR